MASKPLTLAQLVRAVGMREDDVQAYEKSGLLQHARRQRGRSGGLAYHQEHIDRLHFISRALECGFSLDAIADLLRPDQLVTCSDIYRISDRQLKRLQRERPESRATATLKKLMAKCARNGSRDDCSIYATLAIENPKRPLRQRH